MKRTQARGVTTFGALVALFAAFGGFGCLCSLGSHRCGGDDIDFSLPEADGGDGGDATADAGTD